MNVFMVTKPISPYWDEGSKNLAFNLCTKAKKHTFHLLTCKNTKLPNIGNLVYHEFYPKSALNVPKIDLYQKIRLLYKIFSQRDIDIYHFIFTPRIASSLASKLFFKFSKKKSIQTLSTPLTDCKLKRFLFADKIVVLSEWTKMRVLKLGYKNVIKINPGIDMEKFSKSKIPTIRKKLKISEHEFVILFPSEYNVDRGTRVVLKILKRLVGQFPHVKLVFACRPRGWKDAKEKKFLIKSVESLGFKNKVIFLDRIEFMPELINSSDVVVFPIISPFFKMEIPMVLLESLALEKPIIISDVPPINEILLKEKGGLKIKPGDDEDLMKSIAKFVEDKEFKNEVGKEARLLVKEEFNIVDTATEYERVYKELIS